MLAPWFELRSGQGCPLCAPRPNESEYSTFVCKLSVSTLYLARNQAYRGTCAVVYDLAHVTRPSELSADQWQHYCHDLWVAESAVSRSLQPDHVNLECLGNTVPHLHVGIIPRYRSDPRWGRPIWTTSREELAQVQLTAEESEQLASALRETISGAT